MVQSLRSAGWSEPGPAEAWHWKNKSAREQIGRGSTEVQARRRGPPVLRADNAGPWTSEESRVLPLNSGVNTSVGGWNRWEDQPICRTHSFLYREKKYETQFHAFIAIFAISSSVQDVGTWLIWIYYIFWTNGIFLVVGGVPAAAILLPVAMLKSMHPAMPIVGSPERRDLYIFPTELPPPDHLGPPRSGNIFFSECIERQDEVGGRGRGRWLVAYGHCEWL